MRAESARGTATVFLTLTTGETETTIMRGTTYHRAMQEAARLARTPDVEGVDVDFQPDLRHLRMASRHPENGAR